MVMATAMAGILAITIPGLLTTVLWNPYVRAGLVSLGLFLVPGRLVSMATGTGSGRPPSERLSIDFVSSIAVLIPALALPAALGLPLGAFVPAYITTILVLATAAALFRRRSDERQGPTEARAGTLVVTLVVLLAILIAGAAWALTPTGSVDRWWYLAYIRSYMQSPVVSLAEPFLGSGHSPPRFAFNSWLMMMAVWADRAAVSPIWLYERASAPGLVPVAFSALILLARSVFGPGRLPWLAALAGGLLWTGGSLFPVVTRLPEDKLFAVMIVLPVVTAAFVSRLAGGWRRWLIVLALASAVLATTHALIYAIALVTLLPFALLMVWSERSKRSVAGLALAVIMAGAIYPAWTGLAAHSQLENDGASLANRDHPVVRVHWSRGRLVEFADGTYMVKPRLLLHPLMILALVSLPLVWRRRPTERMFLLPATLVPLAIAFIPPLAVLAGRFIFPWMVYRLLWAIPFTLLLALAIDWVGGMTRSNRWIAVLVIVSLAMPWSVKAIGGRFSPERDDLALPGPGAFRATMKRVAALPVDAVVAAAPEISERIPAVAGKRVLALSDRGTIVFSGSRSEGENRLRARASILAGTWTPVGGVPQPTHVLFEPGTAASRYCGRQIYKIAGFELCSFSPAAAAKDMGVATAQVPGAQSKTVDLGSMLFDPTSPLRAECTPPLDEDSPFLHWPRPGPWSARFGNMLCTIRTRKIVGDGYFTATELSLRPLLGNAVEELSITVVGSKNGKQRWRLSSTRRLHSRQKFTLALPHQTIDTLRLSVVPNFLPFLKLRNLSLSIDDESGQPLK
jgi:hypothetical protein